jgi:predicted glycosyltransferase
VHVMGAAQAGAMTSSPTADGRPRIALYSHDTVGLGHTRRQLAIAHALAAHHEAADLLVLTGNPEATRLPVPPRTDLVTLPTVTKDQTGRYVPRRAAGPLDQVLAVRRAVLTAALTSFDPTLLIVDKVPAGLAGELTDALAALSGRCRVVLGLREVLDDPDTTRAEWRQSRSDEVIARHYDEVWVYGDRTVFDPARVYGWAPSTLERTVPLGYLGTPGPDTCGTSATDGTGATSATDDADGSATARPYVLCQLGGGADGLPLARAFLTAPLPAGHDGIVLTGPYLPADSRAPLEALAAGHDGRMRVLPFTDRAQDLLAPAAAVVSMAGYNSTVEILSTAVPALLVPRTHPRREQQIRASALAARGAVDMLAPTDLSPDALAAWTDRATAGDARTTDTTADGVTVTARQRAHRAGIDLSGITALTRRTDDLIGAQSHAA